MHEIGNIIIFTASKRSFRRLCFYTCLSFCPQGRGWYPSMNCRSPGPHPEGGVKLRGLASGVSRPSLGGSPGTHPGIRGSLGTHSGLGGLQAHTWGGIQECRGRQSPPPSRWLLLRAVRILQECIFVSFKVYVGNRKS